MNNTITLLEKNQDCIENSFPIQFFFDMHPRKRQLLNIFFHLDYKYKGTIFISQRKLASLLGITREWANKLVAYLVQQGLISSEQNRNHANYYKISPLFNNETLCRSISKLFKSLYIPLVFLATPDKAPEAVFKKEFTHINVSYLYNNVYVLRNTTKKEGISVMKKEFSPALREIRSISLTEGGMAILSAFPDEALRNTDAEMKRLKDLRNPFGFFYTRCKKYCLDNNIAPDWNLQLRMSTEYDVRANTLMVNKDTASENNHKQEGKKPEQQWKQPESKRYSYMRMRIPYHPQETQATANYRAMLRANNALIDDDEPLPYKGIWPLISRVDTDKSYAEFLNGSKISENIFAAARLINHPISKIQDDEPPVMDYSNLEEDISDVNLEVW